MVTQRIMYDHRIKIFDDSNILFLLLRGNKDKINHKR